MSESKSVIDASVTETTVQQDYFALRQLKNQNAGHADWRTAGFEFTGQHGNLLHL